MVGRPLVGILATLVPWVGLSAQSVRPLIAEYDEPTTSSFEVANPTLFPLTVVVEPWTFELDPEGKPTFAPLPDDVDVRFSETSFRIPPRTTYTVFYEIVTETTPLWFTVYSTIVGPRPEEEEGLRLRLRLPHTVYVYGDPLTREDVVVSGTRFDPDSSRVTLRVDNASERLGRVRWAEARSERRTRESAGFPLLPAAARVIRIPWTEDDRPTSVTLYLDDFEIRVPIPTDRNGGGI